MIDAKDTLDNQYLEWLYIEIGTVRNKNPKKSYWELAKQMYTKEFSWYIPHDDNRCADGIALRQEFVRSENIEIEEVDISWLELECSFLEMLIALARRAAFESFGTTGDWFWMFCSNLQLRHYTDAVYSNIIARKVDKTLDRVINRTYSPNGEGGIFPLKNPGRDQREVELWFQLQSYILEGGYIDHGPNG